eukprot:6477419-Amphidinium_carterae.1
MLFVSTVFVCRYISRYFVRSQTWLTRIEVNATSGHQSFGVLEGPVDLKRLKSSQCSSLDSTQQNSNCFGAISMPSSNTTFFYTLPTLSTLCAALHRDNVDKLPEVTKDKAQPVLSPVSENKRTAGLSPLEQHER